MTKEKEEEFWKMLSDDITKQLEKKENQGEVHSG